MSLCECGCGQELPSNGHRGRRFVDESHRSRARRAQTGRPDSDRSPAADAAALTELRRLKDEVGNRLDDDSVPHHVQVRLLAEFRHLVEAILAIERQKPQPRNKSLTDELVARRAARMRALQTRAAGMEKPS
jgi:hypothetical protein